jgi:uncharacterized protein YcfL
MRQWTTVILATLLLAGCYSSTETQPSGTTMVVPQGASVVCPSGSPAVYSGGAYRC